MPYFRSLKETFVFSARERKGILLMLVLIATVTVYNYTTHLWHTPVEADFSDLEAIVEQVMANRVKEENQVSQRGSKADFYGSPQSGKGNKELSPFPFDPNQLDEEGWIRMGFSEKEAASIVKFRAKSGGFRRPEDLKKSFVMTEERFNRLEPFIVMNQGESGSSREVSASTEEVVELTPKSRVGILIEINTADTTDLKKLKGIGSFYARKIVEYRERLGGFVSEEQLLEIWKFGEERLEGIADEILIDSSFIRKLDANRAEKEELKSHPYINHNLATMWVNYRHHHGPYRSPNDLRKLVLMNDSLLLKLEPYLIFGQ